MKNRVEKNFVIRFLTGCVIGSSVALVFGTYVFAATIGPGVIKAPTFSPTEDDVQLNFLSGLTIVTATGSSCAADNYGPAYIKATCAAGYKVVGGSCSSGNGWPEISHQRNNALSDLSAWECYAYPTPDSGTTCHRRALVAQAFCVIAP